MRHCFCCDSVLSVINLQSLPSVFLCQAEIFWFDMLKYESSTPQTLMFVKCKIMMMMLEAK